MKPERWIWIGGWGLPCDWLQKQAQAALPSAEHTVLPPGPTAVGKIDWSRFDRVAGYSLGAFLLLKEANAIPLSALLLAPFFAYPAEAGLGGKIRLAQIRFLSRWLEREPVHALADFYRRAGLDLATPTQTPYPAEELEWGLRQLAEERAPARLPDGWIGMVGEIDPLLDAGTLLAAEPRLQVVPRAGHHPTTLMRRAFGQ